jgi:hypothetical protein
LSQNKLHQCPPPARASLTSSLPFSTAHPATAAPLHPLNTAESALSSKKNPRSNNNNNHHSNPPHHHPNSHTLHLPLNATSVLASSKPSTSALPPPPTPPTPTAQPLSQLPTPLRSPP